MPMYDALLYGGPQAHLTRQSFFLPWASRRRHLPPHHFRHHFSCAPTSAAYTHTHTNTHTHTHTFCYIWWNDMLYWYTLQSLLVSCAVLRTILESLYGAVVYTYALILLNICPHTTMYVSSYYYICVLTLLYVCLALRFSSCKALFNECVEEYVHPQNTKVLLLFFFEKKSCLCRIVCTVVFLFRFFF